MYFPEYDSRGRFWPHMHDRILFALMLAQVTLIGYFTLKDFTGGTIVLLPLPIISIAYFQYAQSHFYPTFSAQWAPGFAPKYPAPPVEELLEAYTPLCLKSYDDSESEQAETGSIPVRRKATQTQVEVASSSGS